MLNAMRQLSLWMIAERLGVTSEPEEWYRGCRSQNADQLLPWLVEAPDDDAEKFYTLTPDPNDSLLAVLESHDLKPEHRTKLPFNQPTGSQSAALGPIIKRTSSKNKIGPTKKIQNTTLLAFKNIASQAKPWSSYFAEAHDCLTRPKLLIAATGITKETKDGAFNLAIATIADKRTVLLCYQTPDHQLPGEVKAYQQYLMDTLAATKYTTAKVTEVADQCCSLCGTRGGVLPNGVKGAGINFVNIDREGAFPGLDVEDAWKHYALCGACADLLYFYSFHFSSQFVTKIAGDNALVIPSLAGSLPSVTKTFVKQFASWVDESRRGGVKSVERTLLKILASSDAVAELIILWADFGQRIDNVTGVASDILPSKLRELEVLNARMSTRQNSAFPDHPVSDFKFELQLGFLGTMFHRPGGKKAKRENESKRLRDLKRQIAEAIFHGKQIDPTRFYDEVHKTATWYLMEIIEDRNWGYLSREGVNQKGEAYLTLAGWVRHLAMLFNYLRKTGVLPPVNDNIYVPTYERLKPYFTEETAIDTNAKAYAFLIGVLYGKVMQVQAARGVNVGANALTWLKRLTLRGNDLPELYIRVREKLLSYETEASPDVRKVVHELGELGAKTTSKNLDGLGEIDACYFLLLGQSLTAKILPKKVKGTDPEKVSIGAKA